ncbi:MAG: 4-hydroxythreonine-4-phosphate dehydrogenase PdxA [Candidatus Omnitrophota bacterium]
MSRLPKIRAGITMGDPSGIGPDITIKALNRLKGLADFVVIGDGWVLGKAGKGKLKDAKIIDLNNVSHKGFEFGKVKGEYGRASMEYLDKAMQLLKNREIDCLVTCPISKEAINLGGFEYSGHTEYLSCKSAVKDVTMMLLSNSLKISLVTRHIPLKDAPGKIKGANILKTVEHTFKALRQLFGVQRPKIAICGINPHASDNGLIGEEENKTIIPAIKKIRRRLRINIDGPLPADSAIYKTKNKSYDAVVAMYHDQALIPLKLSGKFDGVNLTLGLPFIRTSPLHGVAFDIAKKPGLANPGSLIAAIKLAVKCASSQKRD